MSIHTAALQQLYVTYLNRPADSAGLAFWEQQLSNGLSLEEIGARFAASDEYKKAHAEQTTAQLINSLYQNLFGRDAEADGMAYWKGRVADGMPLDRVAYALSQGAQIADAATLTNKVSAASAFTELLAQLDPLAAAGLQIKGASWLAGVTDAGSLATAIADLPMLAANALNTTVNDVKFVYDFNAAYTKGTFPFKIVFSEAVYVDTSHGTPTLLMQIGDVTRTARYVSGSGSSELRFDLSIQSGDFDKELDYASINALVLNGASIKNAQNADVLLTLPAPGSVHSLAGNVTILVDTIAPVLLSSTPTNGGSGLHTGSNIELHFSEKVNIMDLKLLLQDASGNQSIELTAKGVEAPSLRIGADGTSLIIDPQVALKPHTSYTLSVIDGRIYDAAYNKFVPVTLQFTTGAAGEPVVVAGSGDTAGLLSLRGETSGEQVVLDLKQHTLSQGLLPGGSFSSVDASHLEGTISVRLQDGGINHVYGTNAKDTLIGGDGAVNYLHGGLGSDTLVAGVGSDNTFELAFGDYPRDFLLNLIEGAEQIQNWSAAHSNKITVSGQSLQTSAHAAVNWLGSQPPTVSIDEHGLAHFTNTDYFGFVDGHVNNLSMQFYLASLLSQALKDTPVGTAAVFNQGDSAFLVINAPYQPTPYGMPPVSTNDFIIKLVGVHSDGLVIENGSITTASFIANT